MFHSPIFKFQCALTNLNSQEDDPVAGATQNVPKRGYRSRRKATHWQMLNHLLEPCFQVLVTSIATLTVILVLVAASHIVLLYLTSPEVLGESLKLFCVK